MAKPSTLPRWATGGTAQVTEPTEAKKDLGWVPLEKPGAQYFNWAMKLVYDWLVYLNGLTNESLTWAAKHTFSAGLASGAAPVAATDVVRKTELDAEATARTSGDAARPLDTAVVHNTGNETVAGVKTFSASPVVPTPTASGQAANMGYVDGLPGRASTFSVKQAFSAGLSSAVAPAAASDVARLAELTSRDAKFGWAKVSSTGTIIRSGGGLTLAASRSQAGRYVITATNLHNGIVIASVAHTDDNISEFAEVVDTGVANQLGVSIKGTNNSLSDRAFMVWAFVP